MGETEFMDAVLAVAVVLLVAFVGWQIVTVSKREGTANPANGWLSYLLLWPLILGIGADQDPQVARRNKRVLRVCIMIVLIVFLLSLILRRS